MIASAAIGATGTNVLTYHYDTERSGWQPHEQTLTPANVAGASFGVLHTVTLDDQVDAQPLLVTNQTIAGGVHDVVYVVTENNSVYAIDAESGQILLSRNLFAPMPQSSLPGGCNNNGPNVGIGSTPVIDLSAGAMYLINDSLRPGGPAFQVRELSLSTLHDMVTPVFVTASGQTGVSGTYRFNAGSSRQRAALLESQGTIYAGFASYCDTNANISRGWLLGWQAGTLQPLAQNDLLNRLGRVASPDDFFLTSIWMSGYGPASNGTGNVFFVTGNADYSGTTYKPTANLAESVVEVTADLSHVASYFTPTDSGNDVATLDQNDEDFGSGGAMLIPQTSTTPALVAAAGKAGQLYLMQRTSLGGYNPGGANAVVGEYYIGGCWCGPSAYTGSDKVRRIVTSGGNAVEVWDLQASPSLGLVQQFSTSINTGQDPGFFTSVSSNGTAAGTAVIWALSRPFDATNAISLYAIDPSNGNIIYSGTAGSWPNTTGNANLVPVVANGHVYVASYKSLSIFGLAASGAAVTREVALKDLPHAAPAAAAPMSPHQLTGVVRSANGSRLDIETRDGRTVAIDYGDALVRHVAVVPVVGQPVLARGTYASDGALHADTMLHAKASSASWEPDR
ncbi:MAG TPA: hypothetical protein VKS60_21950 [Stellaceae bacterium]|nr:hypothetical protein [Stellaceae bacterium]